MVVVAPHPDDETLGAGGTLFTRAAAGSEIIVVLVTDGEAARPDVSNLRDVRVDELRRAMSRLAPRGWTLIRAQLPDGQVDRHSEYLARLLEDVVLPDATLLAPFEADGHCDHDAVGQVSALISRKLGVPLVRYPIWAWHRLNTEAFSGMRLGRLALTQDAQAAKANAIQCYVSQMDTASETDVVPPHVLKYFQRPYEVFVL